MIDTGVFKGTEFRFDVIDLFDQIYQIRIGQGLASLPRNPVRAALSSPG